MYMKLKLLTLVQKNVGKITLKVSTFTEWLFHQVSNYPVTTGDVEHHLMMV